MTEMEDLRDRVTELSSYDGPVWTASELHLVRSHLGAATVHERIATWPLGRSQSLDAN